MDTMKDTPRRSRVRNTPKAAKTKRMVCAGCSEECPRLFEVLDSLTFFEGDLVCRKCAADTASETA